MLVRYSLVSGKFLDTSELDLDSLDNEDKLVASDNEDVNENGEEISNWVAMLKDASHSDEEIGLVASISLWTILETLLYSELIMKLK